MSGLCPCGENRFGTCRASAGRELTGEAHASTSDPATSVHENRRTSIACVIALDCQTAREGIWWRNSLHPGAGSRIVAAKRREARSGRYSRVRSHGAHGGSDVLALLDANAGMQLRKSFDMHFVNNGAIPGDTPRSRLSPPVEARIHDHALRNKGRAVALIETKIGVGRPDGVAKAGRVPNQLPRVCARKDQAVVYWD